MVFNLTSSFVRFYENDWVRLASQFVAGDHVFEFLRERRSDLKRLNILYRGSLGTHHAAQERILRSVVKVNIEQDHEAECYQAATRCEKNFEQRRRFSSDFGCSFFRTLRVDFFIIEKR
jgi:hypothetical protein